MEVYSNLQYFIADFPVRKSRIPSRIPVLCQTPYKSVPYKSSNPASRIFPTPIFAKKHQINFKKFFYPLTFYAVSAQKLQLY